MGENVKIYIQMKRAEKAKNTKNGDKREKTGTSEKSITNADRTWGNPRKLIVHKQGNKDVKARIIKYTRNDDARTAERDLKLKR